MSRTVCSLISRAVPCPLPSSSSKKLMARLNSQAVQRSAEASPRSSGLRPEATSDVSSPELSSAVAQTKTDEVVGTVVTPSIVNKPWLRTTAVVGSLLLASYYFQKPLPGQWLRVTHFFAFAAWFGSSVWALLLSPKIMFASLGRQTFGRLQSKLFPQFFGFSALMIVLLMGTKPFAGVPVTLSVAFVTTLINWLILEPIISETAAKRYALQNAESKDAEKIAATVKKASRYHGLSSCLALITLCSAVVHGYALTSNMAIQTTHLLV